MNMFHQIESFFSLNIKKLYEQSEEGSDWVSNLFEPGSSGIPFYKSNVGLEILLERSLFHSIREPHDSVLWFTECVKIIQSLRPYFWNSILFLGPIAEKWPYIIWVGHEYQFQNVIDYFSRQNDEGDHFISILLATSLGERILGNIYLMEGKALPFLLRDILASEELINILGNSLVDFLKVLIGSVNGLNIRNLAWHGFLSPKDVHSDYSVVLVYALHLCGNALSLSNKKIVRRPYLNIQKVCQPLENVWGNVEVNYDDALDIVESSILVPFVMKQFWIKGLNLLVSKKVEALIIFLPLLENALRILYASVCNCPIQVLTATDSEYYITLDEILSPYQMASYSKLNSLGDESHSGIPPLDHTLQECSELINEQIHCNRRKSNNIDSNEVPKCNKVPQVLGKQLMEALYDLFILPSGPRIRDRVSHGEVLPDSVPFNLIVYLFKLCLLILSVDKWRFNDEFAKMNLFTIKCQCESICKENYCSHHYVGEIDNCNMDNRATTKIENTLIKKLVSNLSSYRSIYHPVSDLISNFLSILGCLSMWKEWDSPKCENFVINRNWDQFNTKYSNFKFNFGKCLSISKLSDSEFIFRSSLDLIDIIKTSSQTVLFSASSETEILKLLQRITNNILICIHNIRCSLKSKFKLFIDKSLRSRQRENYRRQLEIIPNIVDNINFILNILIMVFINKNRIIIISKSQFNSLVKILKKILKLFENLVSYTEVTVNKYNESQSILEDNITYLLMHFQ